MISKSGNHSVHWGVIALLASVVFAQAASRQTLDYSVYPRPSENFLAANFRYSCRPDTGPSDTVLVYVPGTDGDGRGAVTNPELLGIATRCNADLLGCYFRGEGLSYDDPSKGSGQALRAHSPTFLLRPDTVKNMAWGETRATVIVGGGPNGDSARTTLFGMVKGAVTPMPSTLYLGVVTPGQTVQKTIHLRSSNSTVHISNIQTPSGVTAVIYKSYEGSDLLLQVQWIGGNRLGSMQGEIELYVDSPEKGTLRVPVYGFVAHKSS